MRGGENGQKALAARGVDRLLSRHEAKKKHQPLYQKLVLLWCGRRDLNPYPVTDTPLKRTRMPIPPRPHSMIIIANPGGVVKGSARAICSFRQGSGGHTSSPQRTARQQLFHRNPSPPSARPLRAVPTASTAFCFPQQTSVPARTEKEPNRATR